MELKEKLKAKLVESLNEDVYKVEHEGHPDADKVKELGHLKPGKKYTNHITKYPESAKKAAAMLKKNGFQGVKIYKNWSVMEGVELPEVDLEESEIWRPSLGGTIKPSAWRISLGGKDHPINRVPIEHHDEFKKQFKGAVVRFRGPRRGTDNTAKADATHFSVISPGRHVSGESGWKHFSNVNESNMTPPGVKVKIARNGKDHVINIRQPNRKVTQWHQTFSSKEEAEKFAHQKWGMNAIMEEVELDEGKMSEIASDIGQHMDKHISNYKRVGGAESLMSHAAKATPKIAKMHGIEHKHAEKFVSDYIDSKLNEESVEEGKDPFAGTPWSSSKTKKNLLDQVKKRVGMDKPDTKEPKSVVKDGKRVFEEAEVDSSLNESIKNLILEGLSKNKDYYKQSHANSTLDQWKKKLNVNYRPGVNSKATFKEVSPGEWHAEMGFKGNVVGKYHTSDPKKRWIKYTTLGGPR